MRRAPAPAVLRMRGGRTAHVRSYVTPSFEDRDGLKLRRGKKKMTAACIPEGELHANFQRKNRHGFTPQEHTRPLGLVWVVRGPPLRRKIDVGGPPTIHTRPVSKARYPAGQEGSGDERAPPPS